MKNTHAVIALLIFWLFPFVLLGQKALVRGFVNDAATLEPLPGASIIVKNKARGAVTDGNGYFELTPEAVPFEIQISYLGYQPTEFVFTSPTDSLLAVQLQPISLTGKSIDIIGRVGRPETGYLKMPHKDIEAIPRFMGEADALKALQLTAGVQTATEGDAGIYVRGGNAAQNLILLDQMPIHSANHLLGIQSVFNPATTASIQLHKGAIPAEYGGRLSSLIEVNSKTQPENNRIAQISAGTLTNGAAINTQLGSSTHFVGGGRYSQLGIYNQLADWTQQKNSFYRQSDYSMYDANGLFTITPNKKHRVQVSFLTTHDDYSFNNEEHQFDNTLTWGNLAFGMHWKASLSTTYQIHQSIGSSSYQSALSAAFKEYTIHLDSRIDDYYYKQTHLIEKDRFFIKSGVEYHHYSILPSEMNIATTDNSISSGSRLKAHEAALFAQTEWQAGEKWTMNAGLRITWLGHVGPYSEPVPDEQGRVSDTLFYANNQLLKQYVSIDPRLAASWQLNENNYFKGSYTITTQNLHMVNVSSVSLPMDIWVPSTKYIRSERAQQLSVGYYHSTKQLEYSIEGYYKHMQNLLEFNGGLFGSTAATSADQNLLTGKGQAFGVELFSKFTHGRWMGWGAYTISKTNRRFTELNNNKWFPSKYDRRHDFSALVQYKINPQLSVSGSFVLASGSRMTVGEGRYIIEGKVANDYGSVNGFKMPVYHRMDISADMILVDKERWSSRLNFSIYNLYNRRNTYFIYFDVQGNLAEYELSVQPEQVSLFPILPSLSWSIQF